MRTKSVFEGSCCAIITPFDSNMHPDYEALGKIVDYQTENQTDAIVACGTTGEASTLSDKEHLDVIRYIVERVNGKIPVIAGTGSNDTAHAVMMSKEAYAIGADALLTVTPYYNKCSQRGLVHHFNTIADATPLPCILYNVPSRTGVNISADTLDILSNHPNIAAIKEASGNMAQVVSMIARCADRIDFYSGCDEINVPMMSVGAKGAISVLANVSPKATHDMLAAALCGDFKKASRLQLDCLELISSLFCDVNPIPVKTALGLMGFCGDNMRLPLYRLSEENTQRLKKSLENCNLL